MFSKESNSHWCVVGDTEGIGSKMVFIDLYSESQVIMPSVTSPRVLQIYVVNFICQKVHIFCPDSGCRL